MAQRIGIADLNYLVARINTICGTPNTPYTRNEQGRMEANIGNYHLSSAYGGHKLVHMCSDGGGVNGITYGYDTKRDLYTKLQAFISGLNVNKQ